ARAPSSHHHLGAAERSRPASRTRPHASGRCSQPRGHEPFIAVGRHRSPSFAGAVTGPEEHGLRRPKNLTGHNTTRTLTVAPVIRPRGASPRWRRVAVTVCSLPRN